MEDDDHDRKPRRRSCGRHCEQARRLMRVSTPPVNNTFEGGDSNDRPKRSALQHEELSDSDQFFWSNKEKKDKNKNSDEIDPCDDDYMLKNLHQLKQFTRKVLNYAWCYTQYCYPGLRTAEYYKKVKRVCQEKEKAKKNEKKDKKKDDKKKDKKKDEKKLEHKTSQVEPVYLSTGAASSSLLSDSSTQTSDENEWPDLDDSDGDDDPHDSRNRPKVKPLKRLKPLRILPALEEELGWGQYAVKRFRELSQAISNFINDTDEEYQIGALMKVMCLILAPVVMWLGVNYLLLKRKYKSLSGKLRRIKEENDVLKKESGKLGIMLSTTEKLKMPFSTKESRQQVVAEFTRLAESRMKSKKEITRLTTEKQALLEELKMAKKQRDVARNQYSSLTQEVLETDSFPYVQT